jgi:hypothetical protein
MGHIYIEAQQQQRAAVDPIHPDFPYLRIHVRLEIIGWRVGRVQRPFMMGGLDRRRLAALCTQ